MRVNQKLLASFEGNKNLSHNSIVTLRKSQIGNEMETIRSFVFKLLINSLGNMGIVPTSWTVGASCEYFSCVKCEYQLNEHLTLDTNLLN